MKELVRRIMAPTPRFFKRVRGVGMGLATVGGVLMAAPVTLPVGLVALGGYLIVAGGIMGAVSQTAVDSFGVSEAPKEEKKAQP